MPDYIPAHITHINIKDGSRIVAVDGHTIVVGGDADGLCCIHMSSKCLKSLTTQGEIASDRRTKLSMGSK